MPEAWRNRRPTKKTNQIRDCRAAWSRSSRACLRRPAMMSAGYQRTLAVGGSPSTMCHDVLKPRKHALQDLSLDLFVLADAPAHLSQLKPVLRAR